MCEQPTIYTIDPLAIKRQLKTGTAPAVVAVIVEQFRTANNARARIQEEGTVVRSPKGEAVAHPALEIEQKAVKLATDLIFKFK